MIDATIANSIQNLCEAALCQSLELKGVDEMYPAKQLDFATELWQGKFRLRHIFNILGRSISSSMTPDELAEAVRDLMDPRGPVAFAFTNVANRLMIDGWESRADCVDWRKHVRINSSDTYSPHLTPYACVVEIKPADFLADDLLCLFPFRKLGRSARNSFDKAIAEHDSREATQVIDVYLLNGVAWPHIYSITFHEDSQVIAMRVSHDYGVRLGHNES